MKDNHNAVTGRAEYARDFRARWESEIRQESEHGYGRDGVLWYWETEIEAQVEDGTLPRHALDWQPPAWLRSLDADRSAV